MDEITRLKNEIKALNEKRDAILDKDEAGADDVAELEAIASSKSELEGKLNSAEKLEAARAQREAERAHAAAPRTIPNGIPITPGSSIEHIRTHENILDDPTAGFRTYGHFCDAVRIAGTDPSQTDKTLLILNDAYGANTESGSEGGFLVPKEYSNKMVSRMNQQLPILGMCDILTLTGTNSVSINGMVDANKSSSSYQYGGVVVYFVGDGEQVTRSSLKFRQIDLKLNSMAALSFATRDMLKYVSNYGSRLMDTHAAAIQDKLTGLILFGTGVKQPLGAFTGAPSVEVAIETDQDPDTIVAENIFGMEEALWAGSDGNAVWLYNQFCHKQLRTLALSVGTGGELVKLFSSQGREKFIDGVPAYRTNKCKKLGDAGDILLGDFSQYIIATAGAEDMAMSIHLRFDYGETAFRTFFDVDGRPAWDAAVTPENGNTNDSASPFVKLAERA